MSKLGLAGLIYGIGLTVLGVCMAGAGHGTYLFLAVAAAPLSVFGILFSIVSPPILWSVVGSLLSHAGKTPQKQVVVCVMLLHYLGIMFIPFFGEDVQGKYFERMWAANPAIVLVGGSLYLVGQVATWVYWIKAGRDSIQKSED